VAVPNPGGEGPTFRGATLVVTLNKTAHQYRLAQIAEHPFQAFTYQGVPLAAPLDLVDR
jgi:hypothetical protein